MTDDRPRPQYGEYAPIGVPAPAPLDQATVKPTQPEVSPVARRTWDIALTMVLLTIGVADVVGSFPTFGNLAPVLSRAYEQQAIGTFTFDGLANDMGVAMNVVRVVLLGIAIGLGLFRIVHRKIAFWVPLAAGTLAFITVCGLLLVVVLTDPALAEYAVQRSNTP